MNSSIGITTSKQIEINAKSVVKGSLKGVLDLS